MKGYVMATEISINDPYKSQCWAQDENLNWNRIPFTIDGMLGPVSDCATETSLAYRCLGCISILLNSYLMQFSIHIAVLMLIH